MTKDNQKSKAKTSKRDDENSMWSWFEDLVIDGRLLSFTDHAGIELKGVAPAKVWDVFRGHYTRSGAIDIHNLQRTWEPGVQSSAVSLKSNLSVPAVRAAPKQRSPRKCRNWTFVDFNRGVYRQGNTLTIAGRGIVSWIDIISTATHFGGRREWFKCPDCGGRARILYGPDFACRSCQRLTYQSTSQCSRVRAITRAVLLRRNLGGDGSLLEPFPAGPKG